MKARMIVWNGPSSEYRNGAGFKTLNEYRYGPIKDIEEITPLIAEEMEKEISLIYPGFHYNHAEVLANTHLD